MYEKSRLLKKIRFNDIIKENLRRDYIYVNIWRYKS